MLLEVSHATWYQICPVLGLRLSGFGQSAAHKGGSLVYRVFRARSHGNCLFGHFGTPRHKAAHLGGTFLLFCLASDIRQNSVFVEFSIGPNDFCKIVRAF